MTIEKLLLIRHGSTLQNEAGVLLGKSNIGLSPRGIDEANVLATFLTSFEIDAVFSSPQERAIETAQVLANRLKLHLEICPALQERELGPFDGLSRSELLRNVWACA